MKVGKEGRRMLKAIAYRYPGWEEFSRYVGFEISVLQHWVDDPKSIWTDSAKCTIVAAYDGLVESTRLVQAYRLARNIPGSDVLALILADMIVSEM